jgi:hypothetical protein
VVTVIAMTIAMFAWRGPAGRCVLRVAFIWQKGL